MDKITLFLKYTGTLSFATTAEAFEQLISIPNRKECSFIFGIGNTEFDVDKHHGAHISWHADDRLLKIHWHTTESERAMLEFTSEKQDLFNSHDWSITITVENAHVGTHTSQFFNKFEIFNSVSADNLDRKILDFPEGKYVFYNQTVSCWKHDGCIIAITDRPDQSQWQKHNTDALPMNSPLRFARVEWGTNIVSDDNKSYYYYEMSRPNNEIGTSFQEDFNNNSITINDEFVKEFIDQINLTCPYMKKTCNTWQDIWPNIPFTLDLRFRDSKGYYFVFFAEQWTSEHSQWTNNQVNYLKTFLDRTPNSISDQHAILAYAREKWTIQ